MKHKKNKMNNLMAKIIPIKSKRKKWTKKMLNSKINKKSNSEKSARKKILVQWQEQFIILKYQKEKSLMELKETILHK